MSTESQPARWLLGFARRLAQERGLKVRPVSWRAFSSVGPSSTNTANKRAQAHLLDLSGDIRTTYADGGQHPLFLALLRQEPTWARSVARKLAFAGREMVVIPARPKRPVCPGHPECPTQVAEAKGATHAPPKVWPAAASLLLIQGALPPLVDEPSVFTFAPLDVGSATMAAKPTIPGSLRILPTHLAVRTPGDYLM